MFTPVILAGGNGSRLWPLSRQSFPKQFLALDGQDQGTMFQRTLARLDGLEHSPAVVVSNENHRFIVAEQLRVAKMKSRRIILEPLARNTAPAIALAALDATADGSDPILLVLAADHHIHDENAFRDAVRVAQSHAEAGRLVTFGITPTHAETGFGYIQCGEAIEQGGFAIAAFKEKPSPDMAEEYLSSGVYLWNSGMFMFRASVFLKELGRHRPDILSACRVALSQAEIDSHFMHVPAEQFALCADESVDYAVMEHTAAGLVVPLDAGWNDLGSWAAIWDVGPHDANKNRLEGDVMAIDTHNCLVQSHHRLVATVGLQDLIVIETKDAVLVANKHDSQQVKDVVKRLQAEERAEFVTHPLVNRPWPLRHGRQRRALSGQAHQRFAGRMPVVAAALPSRRTLDRCVRHRSGHLWRQRTDPLREPVHVHPARGQALAVQPGQGTVGVDRSAIRSLPGRRRHRALRRPLRTSGEIKSALLRSRLKTRVWYAGFHERSRRGSLMPL